MHIFVKPKTAPMWIWNWTGCINLNMLKLTCSQSL